jgi:hypothetical protein
MITNSDVMLFYQDKKEHYPISDDFIKQYQQKTIGEESYINHALKTGHLICDAIAEPNQKWHLLEAYYIQQILKNGIEYLYEKNTCCRLSCPELILWMAEAAEVQCEVINIAKIAAMKQIDYIKKESSKAFSAEATRALNKTLKESYGKTLWSFIEEKIFDWKNPRC